MMTGRKVPKFALCIRNDDCEDLELRKVYPVIPDKKAEKEGYLRIIHESGEDYLYPCSFFVIVRLPREAQRMVAAAK